MTTRRAAVGFVGAGLAAAGWAGAAGAATVPIWKTIPPARPLPATTASGYVVHDGARIYYATFGHGRPVILLHGGFANGEAWGNQVPALMRAGYQAVVIDSRGHGRSSRDARPLTYELMASDVVAVMDHLTLPPADVVGWSDGAIIGLVMALKHPDRVTRVFAFAANMDPSGVKDDVETNPTFAGFEKQAAVDYRSLSPTPTDYADFQAALDDARTACDDRARLEACRQAAGLYRGPLADGAGYDWAEPYAETARRRALDAWARIAQILGPEKPDEALAALEAAVGHEPYNEWVYQAIMRLQADAGRPDAVRRTLGLLEARLADLAVTPGAQTRQLAAALLGPPAAGTGRGPA